MPVLFTLAVVWAAFLLPPALRRHRDGRPGSSVVSFRQQLSTLERATPGHSLRLSTTGPVPIVKSVPPGRKAAQVRRRRVILLGLTGITAVMFLAALAVGGMATLLFVFSAMALATYVWALVQIRRRTEERQVKVRVLAPRVHAVSAGSLALRRTASS